jgi:hypothetical protein
MGLHADSPHILRGDANESLASPGPAFSSIPLHSGLLAADCRANGMLPPESRRK